MAALVPLGHVSVEAQLLEPLPPGQPPLVVPSADLGGTLSKWLFRQPVSDNELFIAAYKSTRLVLRVAELGGEEMLEEEGIEAHIFRGLIGPRTELLVCPSTSYKGSASQQAVADGLQLTGVVKKKAARLRNILLVHTNDGETFPVSKQLLRPCISLTSAIRRKPEGDQIVEEQVDVDCLTFDRVLLFLEVDAKGGADRFAFDIASLEEMAKAAQVLQYRQLRESCEKRLGDFQSRVRMHQWIEVVHHNNSGGCWITMDGMVFDLEAWLPEHPGGSTIIPQQALNKDCVVFFELYHASRESFQYLREFYIGELWPEERSMVPMEEETASAEFMQQIKDFCASFRLDVDKIAILHARSHLGAH
mmetsp:Transcript_37980/g.62789  ORF Transcript_37980/g.62789 Transcript_37980/m.62789 type:complete len:362 (+) Transcript_37980:2-1087(+)